LIASETGISKQDFDNMLLVEKDLFEELMKCIEISDKKLNLLLNGGEETNFQNNLLVSFTENIDSFVSSEGENYGPYKKGQFANLPSSIAKVFLDDGVAEEM